MIEIQIKPDLEDTRRALTRLGIDLSEAIKSILSALATAGKKRIQQRMGAYIGSKTGWLRKHVYGIRRSATHYVVAAPRHIAEPLESGATITAKKSPYLIYKNSEGQFRKAKMIRIPARRWFTQAMRGFETSPEYDKAIDKGMERAIKRYNKKSGEAL